MDARIFLRVNKKKSSPLNFNHLHKGCEKKYSEVRNFLQFLAISCNFFHFFTVFAQFFAVFFLPILPKPYNLTCQPTFSLQKTSITSEKISQKSYFPLNLDNFSSLSLI